MTYMLRADSFDALTRLSTVFDRAVNGAAYALGAVCEIKTRHGSSPLKNSESLCDIYRRCVEGLVPDAQPSIRKTFIPGCTDMGDPSEIIPSVHGCFPCCAGTCHGTDFRIADQEQAYLLSSKLLACMALELIAGDAGTGKKIAEEKKDKRPIPEYLKKISGFESHTIFPPAE